MRALGPVTVTGALALFWVLILVAGVLSDGYTLQDNYMSALAARGSDVAVLGVAALSVFAAAHGLAAWFVRRLSPLTAVFLVGAAVAFGAAAAFRSDCPGGAAGCRGAAPRSRSGPDVDRLTTLHGIAALEYQFFVVAAVVTLAAVALRHRTWWLAGASLGAALVSMRLFAREGDHLGILQRLWLLDHSVWLVLAVAVSAPAAARPRPAAGP